MRKVTIFLSIVYLLYCYIFYNSITIDKELDARLSAMRKTDKDKNGSCGYIAYYVSLYLDSCKTPYSIVRFSFGRYKNVHIAIKTDECAYIDQFGYLPDACWLYFLNKKVISRQELLISLKNDKWNKDFNMADTSTIKNIILGK